MKKTLLLLAFLYGSLQMLYSQNQEDGVVSFKLPVRNSMKFNKFLLNPTFSFVKEQGAALSFYNKREWVQFDDAPQTYLFSYSGRFRENEGISVGLFQQNYGVLTTFGGVANFAHNVVLQQDSNLTFGLNVGFYKSGLNKGSVVSNTIDPSLENIPSNSLLTVNPGINYGVGNLDFGVSMNNLFLYNVNSSKMVENDPEKSIQAHIMHTGYLNTYGFFDKSKFSALVSSEFKKEKTVISGLMMFAIPTGIWIQAGYNTLYGASGGLGLNLTPRISIEYNFEKSLGDLSNFGSSHEIVLAYKFKRKNIYYGEDEEEGAIIPVTVKKYVPTKPNQSAVSPPINSDKLKGQKADDSKADALTQTQKAKEAADAKAKADALAQTQKAKEAADAKANADALAQAQKTKETAVAKAKADALAQTQKAKEAADSKAKADALAQTQKAKETADAKAKADALAQTQKAKEVADAKAKADALAQAQKVADAKAKADALAQQAKEAADSKAKADALAQAQKAKEAADAKAKADAETKLANVTKDENAKSMDDLAKMLDQSKNRQKQLLGQLETTVSNKEKELKELKEENDLSEKGIFKEPKPFKSITEENKAIEALKKLITDENEQQNKKIKDLDNLYKERLTKVPSTNDAINQNYKNTIDQLKSEQSKVISSNNELISSLEKIKVDTEIERKRRIKRAAFVNADDKYTQDVATLKRIKETTSLSATPLKPADFDFGAEQLNTQILKNINNFEKGYYLVIAVHNDVAKRDTFLTKVVSAGQTDVNFLYDVNSSNYYIYYDKFINFEDAQKALSSKGDKPYNGKMAVVKVE